MTSPEIRVGRWVARPSRGAWVVGRLTPGGSVKHRRFFNSAAEASEGVLMAFQEEMGATMPQEAINALQAHARAWGEQLSLAGIEPEEAARDRALEAMEASELRAHYLEIIRREMKRRGEAGLRCTPDYARVFFESLDPPPPELLSRNFLGCVFRSGEWQVVGTYQSSTPGSHANRLNIYALKKKA